MVNNWFNIIQDCLFPPTCIFCSSPGSHSLDLCHLCQSSLTENESCCYKCGGVYESTHAIPWLCGRCQSHPPAFDETHAPYLYQGGIKHLITNLKFNGHFKNARTLGTLLAQNLTINAEIPEVIIPVPLHHSRYLERGFNQSIEIARTVAKELKVPLDLTSCIRSRNTPHQTGLHANQRRKNLRQAFLAKNPLPFRHAALLDDVMTTGATVHELALTLIQSGVTRVDVWVCARA